MYVRNDIHIIFYTQAFEEVRLTYLWEKKSCQKERKKWLFCIPVRDIVRRVKKTEEVGQETMLQGGVGQTSGKPV